jgi:hypothetical protein
MRGAQAQPPPPRVNFLTLKPNETELQRRFGYQCCRANTALRQQQATRDLLAPVMSGRRIQAPVWQAPCRHHCCLTRVLGAQTPHQRACALPSPTHQAAELMVPITTARGEGRQAGVGSLFQLN